ncbi:MAG: hypothetical protein L7S62_08665, partial [Flavobacteriales bacterium]|nr:hypothetical protein [Flavobacteriales bacterium]
DGSIYTYYCDTAVCDESYWASLDLSEAIPNPDTYSFDGETLIWDDVPQVVTFECDGGILHLSLGGQFWRLGSDCSE